MFLPIAFACTLVETATSTTSTGLPSVSPDRAVLQDLVLPTQRGIPFRVEVALGEDVATLVLAPHDVRSARFELHVEDASGVRVVAPTPAATVRGYIEGRPDFKIAGALTEAGLSALILDGSGDDDWTIEPAGSAAGSAMRTHRISRMSESATPLADGAHRIPTPPSLSGISPLWRGSTLGLSTVKVCELACDSDTELYAANGSSITNTTDFIEAIVNVGSLIYEQSVGLVYEVNTILVRTAEPDPYPPQDLTSDMVANVRAEWNANQTAILRDHVHMFSGKSSSHGGYGGGQMCDVASSYSISLPLMFSTLGQRAIVFSHEVGHSWGACHCNVIPFCNPSSMACEGIMNTAYGSIPAFDAYSQQQILTAINAATCLHNGTGSVAPGLSQIAPGQVDVLGGETITLTGTDFDRATSVTSNGTVFNLHHFTVVDDQTITFTAPSGTALGPVGVTVSGPGGSSSVQRFGYVQTDPPRLLSDSPNAPPGQTVVWDYGSFAGRRADVLISLSSATTTINGWPVLSGATVDHSALLNSIGIGQHTKAFSFSDVGLTYYIQVALYDPVTSVLVASTNVVTLEVIQI